MIDFRAIRPIRGSANNGFEELCCQLAGAEPVADGRYVRNGTPDGGVECYWLRADGEWGWQAKYFDKLGDSQWQQMDDSVEAALRTHPRLTRLTFCLPFNLPDGREPGKRSQRERWDDRVAKWQEWAAARNMTVRFDLWDETQLLERLARPANAGRSWFWFRNVELTPEWIRQHVRESLAAAGPRYTPEVHVDLPIAQHFETLGHTQAFRDRLRARIHALRQAFADIGRRSIAGHCVTPGVTDATLATFDELVVSLHGLTLDTPLPPPRPVDGQLSDVRHALLEVQSAIEESRKVPSELAGSGKAPPRSSEYSSHDLNRCWQALSEFDDLAEAASLDLVGRPALLLSGDAGTGKSHLLCDIANRRTAADLPTLLLMGQQFAGRDVWTQLIQSGLRLNCSRDELLGALSSAAEAAGGRAVIVIDAINEAGEVSWKEELPRFLDVVSRHPRIGVVISCRSTYVDLLVRTDLLRDRFTHVIHSGFADDDFNAVDTFCRHYGIESLNAPPLTPEFDNPLFLKLFCEGLRGHNLRRPPRGQHGLRHVFAFYIDAVNRELSRPERLDYHEADRIVHKAVDAVADEMIRVGADRVPRGDAERILSGVLPRTGGYSRSLLRHLVSEGVLAEDVYWGPTGDASSPVIRFGYERQADFEVVRRLVEQHLDTQNPERLFTDGGRFATWFVTPQELSRRLRLLPVLMILVKERTGREVADYLPHVAAWKGYRRAFLEALPWRRAADVTPDCTTLFQAILEAGPHGGARQSDADAAFERVASLAAVPGHPLNARWLHGWLSRFSMAERDRVWSTYLHRAWRGPRKSAITRLIAWAWPATTEDRDPGLGCDDDVVELAAVALTWCLTTPNRFIRDRATKALVSLLHRRLPLLETLQAQFSNANDLYLVERLYAVCYGCALRSPDRGGLGDLAQRTFDRVFASGHPPAHVLLRDYARGIVEFASYHGVPPRGDVNLIRPPYRSEPPPETAPAWEDIRSRYDDPAYGELIQSLWPNGGDFDRYVLGTNAGDGNLRPWTDRPNPFTALDELDALRIDLPVHLAGPWSELTNPFAKFLRGRGRVISGPPEDQDPDSDPVDELDPFGEDDPGDTERIDAFKQSLSDEDRSLLDRHVAAETAWHAAYHDLRINRDDLVMPMDLPCRWIFQRVLELGWTPERFGEFDSEVDAAFEYGREANKPERVGKKYQWLAYHELTARIFDHRPMRHDQTWGTTHYEGTWQEHLRQIDPSCLLPEPAAGDGTPCWWVPVPNPLLAVETMPDARWVRDLDSIPSVEAVLAPTNPRDGRSWLTLRASVRWQQSKADLARLGRNGERLLSFSVFAVIVQNERRQELLTELAESDWGGTDVPEMEFYSAFLGEYGWAPSFREYDTHAAKGLSDPIDDHNMAVGTVSGTRVPVASTAMRYLGGSCGFDCSHVGKDAAGGYVPSPWLSRRLGLRWAGRRFDFLSASGDPAALDPSYAEAGPVALLIDRSILADYLKANGLSLVWLVIGEKLVLGNGYSSGEREGVQLFRRHYHFADGAPAEASRSTVHRKRGGDEVLEFIR